MSSCVILSRAHQKDVLVQKCASRHVSFDASLPERFCHSVAGGCTFQQHSPLVLKMQGTMLTLSHYLRIYFLAFEPLNSSLSVCQLMLVHKSVIIFAFQVLESPIKMSIQSERKAPLNVLAKSLGYCRASS